VLPALEPCLKIASEKHLSVPINRLLVESIKEIEAKRADYSSVEEFYENNQADLEKLHSKLEILIS
jgi:hypothetical protein